MTDGQAPNSEAVRTCGCASDPRRVCDLCGGAAGPFLACSLACLQEHLRAAHGPEGLRPTRERAAGYQAQVNRNVAGNRKWYAGHRQHVMKLVKAAGAGRDVCVLGAGNGSDLDLPALAKSFTSVHLVDLDGEALERCRQGAPAAIRDRIVLHAGVDLSGFAERLDEWGERFPDDAELGRLALAAINGLLQQVGRRFDVVLSTCVLSQLPVPYHRTWILPAAGWGRLFAAITAIHLATLAGLVEPGGTGLLVFDVLSSKNAPGLATGAATSAALQARVAALVAGGQARLDPEPAGLVSRLQSPGLAALVEGPRLTPPWLWNIGGETQLVYGLVFRRPPASA